VNVAALLACAVATAQASSAATFTNPANSTFESPWLERQGHSLLSQHIATHG